MNPIDRRIQQLRDDTPGCRQRLHFNNAGAALCPAPVHQALVDHLALEQRIGGYEAAAEASQGIDRFYQATGRLLNCDAAEIAWAENASAAWNTLLQALSLEPGDRIVTGQSEYAGNFLSLLHLARQRQLHIDIVPNDPDGRIDLQRLEAALASRVKLVALTHVASQNGTVQPAREVGELARRHRIDYLLDAAQSAGQIPLNVEELGCDMLVGTGRKFLRGPRGSAFLCARHTIIERLEPPRVDLHSARWTGVREYRFHDDARRFESFECSVAGKIALGRAVAYANELGVPDIHGRVMALARRLRSGLAAIPGLVIDEAMKADSGIVTFHSREMEAATVCDRLREQGINTSVARHDGTRLDFERRKLKDINRASVHYYNTEQEVDRFCERIEALVAS